MSLTFLATAIAALAAALYRHTTRLRYPEPVIEPSPPETATEPQKYPLIPATARAVQQWGDDELLVLLTVPEYVTTEGDGELTVILTGRHLTESLLPRIAEWIELGTELTLRIDDHITVIEPTGETVLCRLV